MDYFESLNYFFQFAQFRNLPTSARITYLAILHRWNGFRRPTSFALSDRELSSLTGLGIGRALTQSKRLLKNLGLIDFKSTSRGTTYFFNKNSGTNQTASSDTPPTTNATRTGVISNTQDFNKKKEEKEKAGAREDVILTF